MSWIKNVQSKPIAERIKIIWIAAGVCVGILIIVWIIVGGVPKEKPQGPGFFQSISNTIKDAKQNIPAFPTSDSTTNK